MTNPAAAVQRLADVRTRLIDAEADAVHTALVEWLGRSGVERNLHAALDRFEGRMRDVESGACIVRTFCPELASSVQSGDVLPRVIDLPGGESALARIRFRADGNNVRFIAVEAMTFAPRTTEEVDGLLAGLQQAFAPFQPRRVRVYVHGGARGEGAGVMSAIPAHPRATAYKRLLAAPLVMLQERAATLASDDASEGGGGIPTVTVAPPTTFDFYDDYARRYEQFWRERPDLKHLVRCETLDDLMSFHAAGGLRLVLIGGEIAGVMAASPGVEHGLRGWWMRERFLYDTHRGQGLGAAALAAFLRSLPSRPHDLLYGTIAPKNQPSMRSALALGRVDVGGLWWIELPHAR
ncbi:MAG: hypothetical protein HRU76_00680 [Phycisphaeraceae bacterium]|nr:hypothetical protein [Phycisphaerales bacterium]QOJ16199.1 MAG: hypothetical protein HRU76_00680 [Phycisphaeraceae bacterium]